jgi:hypothetical protein
MDQVASILERPKLYNNIDGVGELGGGFMCLGWALLLWLQVHSPRDAVWHQMYAFVIYVGVMCSILHYGTRAIKNRITYPRTGFVEYRTSQAVWSGIIAACVASLVAVGVAVAFRRHWDITAAVPTFGLLIAASYGYGFARAVRWKWVVAGAMAIGSFAITFLPASLLAAVAGDSWATRPVLLLTLIVYGPILLISGGISFWLYLRHTQAPAREGQ